MKVSKLNFNGNSIPLNDENALQLPEGVELEDGDVLVYDETTNSFIATNKNNLVDVEKGVVENSDKLVKSGDVFTAIDAATNNENYAKLEVSYDSLYNKILFNVAQDTPAELEVEVSLLILSINTSYDQQEEEFKFSNIIDILHLTPFNTSAEKQLSVYSEDRQFYFILVNNSQRVQCCELTTDTLLVPGINEKTNITITAASSSVGGNPVVILTASNNVNVDININLRLSGRTTGQIRNITGVFASGTSSKTIQVGSSGEDRVCEISISPSAVSDTQNYVLQTTSVEFSANLTQVAIRAIPSYNSPIVTFSTVNGQNVQSNIDIKLVCPRNGYSSLILTGTILANSSSGTITYDENITHQGFNGPIVGVAVGENNSDNLSQYYIESTPITLILDGQGNPY